MQSSGKFLECPHENCSFQTKSIEDYTNHLLAHKSVSPTAPTLDLISTNPNNHKNASPNAAVFASNQPPGNHVSQTASSLSSSNKHSLGLSRPPAKDYEKLKLQPIGNYLARRFRMINGSQIIDNENMTLAKLHELTISASHGNEEAKTKLDSLTSSVAPDFLHLKTKDCFLCLSEEQRANFDLTASGILRSHQKGTVHMLYARQVLSDSFLCPPHEVPLDIVKEFVKKGNASIQAWRKFVRSQTRNKLLIEARKITSDSLANGFNAVADKAKHDQSYLKSVLDLFDNEVFPRHDDSRSDLAKTMMEASNIVCGAKSISGRSTSSVFDKIVSEQVDAVKESLRNLQPCRKTSNKNRGKNNVRLWHNIAT